MVDPRETYLESQVLTATPQKLRLMLIDGALRHLNSAAAELDKPGADPAAISESLTKARAIVSELLSSIRDDGEEVAKKLIALYLFLFQSLTEAQLQARTDNISQVINVLEVERETWRQVCEQNPEAPSTDERQQAMGREILASGPAIPPTFQATPTNDAPPAGGFSVDA